MLSPFINAVNPVYPQPFCQPESDLLVFSSLQIITVRQISTEQRVRLELHFNRPFDNDNRWGKLLQQTDQCFDLILVNRVQDIYMLAYCILHLNQKGKIAMKGT